MNIKNEILVPILVILFLGVGYLLFVDSSSVSKSAINSFEECAAAGHPIMESYPEQCRTPDGRVFVRVITEPAPDSVVVPPSGTGNSSSPGGATEPVACTMDAMQCPDGSWVGRSGPNCQFVCPGQ